MYHTDINKSDDSQCLIRYSLYTGTIEDRYSTQTYKRVNETEGIEGIRQCALLRVDKQHVISQAPNRNPFHLFKYVYVDNI